MQPVLPPITAADWEVLRARLHTLSAPDEIDDLIDSVRETFFASSPSVAASAYLRDALNRAGSALTIRSAALALALAASPTDSVAVDALVGMYKRFASDVFLAPVLVDALGLLALRSPLGRIELSSLRLRLHLEDNRYL